MQYIVDEIIENNNSSNLELHNYDPTIYEQLVIPNTIQVYISDLCIKKHILPDTLKVLDISPFQSISMEFNMPTNIHDIILRDVDILNKSIMELFPKKAIYRYVGCTLNGIPLNTALNQLYYKYFQKEPKYTSHRVFNQPILQNTIYYRFHNAIINEIKDYEKQILSAKKFSQKIKIDLIEQVWHPDRVEKIINVYGIDYLDTL